MLLYSSTCPIRKFTKTLITPTFSYTLAQSRRLLVISRGLTNPANFSFRNRSGDNRALSFPLTPCIHIPTMIILESSRDVRRVCESREFSGRRTWHMSTCNLLSVACCVIFRTKSKVFFSIVFHIIERRSFNASF